jgi:PKD repeat protein/predicted secreted protein
MKKIFTLVMMLAIIGLSNDFAQNFIKVTRTNQEQTINLSNDQVLEIQLPRKASTGYVWCESTNSEDKTIQKSITQIGESDFIHDPVPAAVGNRKGIMAGRSGIQVMRYVGAAQGTTVLTLELRRPWILNGEIIDSYTITVVSEDKYSGSYAPAVKPVHKLNKPLTSVYSTLPSKWDWRSQCTPIENQGGCGDCWAYATVGDFECNIKIRDGVTRDLSEEFITDCMMVADSVDFLGCNGGWCANEAWMKSYTAANSAGGGAVYESDDNTTCNSTGITGTCGAPYTPHETIDKYADIGGEDSNSVPSVDSIKYHIYYDGPIWVCLDASGYGFSGYSSGVLNENETSISDTDIDHAICLVGWNDTTVADGSGGYWILRNSWGPGWGMSGYMYISYASDLIGAYADYIVYKGGTPHNIPPVANFTAGDTTSCTGTIQFSDQSMNFPTSWSWNFGDGGISTTQNPVYTYTANGTYTVSLVAVNAYGNDTATHTNYITINMPAIPTVIGDSTTYGGSVTLYASGTDTLNWYNASTGGTLVNTGISYTISPLDSNETFYVENDIPHAVQAVGMTTSGTGGYYTLSAEQGLVFDAYTPVIIKTVDVYANSNASRTIYLKNSAGATLNSLTTTIPSGHQTVTLNFNVPAGTGFVLSCSASNNLWRETTDAYFPYSISGIMSITGNTVPDGVHYYYFYNWKVTEAPCTSPRVPVHATVIMGINEFYMDNFAVYPNPAIDNITIGSSFFTKNQTISVYDIQGQLLLRQPMLTAKTNINIADFSKGLYFLKVENGIGIVVKKFVKE